MTAELPRSAMNSRLRMIAPRLWRKHYTVLTTAAQGLKPASIAGVHSQCRRLVINGTQAAQIARSSITLAPSLDTVGRCKWEPLMRAGVLIRTKHPFQ